MACNGDCHTQDEQFWQELRSLLLQMVCLIEKTKLGHDTTTADLRKAGKRVLREGCKDQG